MAVCLVCGKFDDLSLEKAMGKGWVFTRCPECQRGNQLDILMMYLSRTMGEKYLDGFCERHWFKDTGICGYCKMRREGINENVA